MSMISQILSPGGGILLIPFIRGVIMCLFATTTTAFLCGVARIHMAILSFLAGCLLLSISFFVGEYEKAMSNKSRGSSGGASSSDSAAAGERAKTD
mmetsp:Transcript_23133/g.33852  ORF Transcript_23133/g.33852 Transcript_23133/m.33852 type:complete len:96 (-) Transcript_23133:163-450(-)